MQGHLFGLDSTKSNLTDRARRTISISCHP